MENDCHVVDQLREENQCLRYDIQEERRRLEKALRDLRKLERRATGGVKKKKKKKGSSTTSGV